MVLFNMTQTFNRGIRGRRELGETGDVLHHLPSSLLRPQSTKPRHRYNSMGLIATQIRCELLLRMRKRNSCARPRQRSKLENRLQQVHSSLLRELYRLPILDALS